MSRPPKPKPPAPEKPIYPRWRDAALIEAIAADVDRGWSCEVAGFANGVSRRTVGAWLERFGAILELDEPTADDAEFLESLRPIARAWATWYGDSEVMAAEGHAGRQWMLARRLQSIYGQKSEVAVSTPDAGVGKLLERLTGNGPP